jgi:TolB-like protein/DNA-binding winged helix-turn-helix (wHTH) protein/Flp pilus assembly protein TadD
MSSVNNSLYAFADFRLDPQNRVLRRGGATVPMTPKAFDLLLVLVQNAGRIVTKDELMKTVWPDSFVEESNLTQTVFMVRKALGETADRRYILTAQGQGYRFLVPVEEATLDGPEGGPAGTEKPVPASDTVEVREVPAQPSPRQITNWRPLVITSAAVALILIVVSVLWPWHSRPRVAEQSSKIALAVLPFENFTGDSSEDYFSDGLTEEMIGQLGNLDPAHLGVIARTSVMHYKHSQESIPAIGRDLGVQYVIEGSVRRDAKRVRITVQLIQVKDQSHLWARQYDRDLGDLLELQEEVAREVANEIEFSLSGRRPIEPARAAAPVRGANSYETYDLYLKGRYFWNKRTGDGFRQAADYFQQAIDKDPNFARAYAGLADTFALMSTWYIGPQNELMPKARAMALRALQLDESLADAHASLAMIKENYDYDWPGAEKEFRRALELDPQYATAHQWYAEFLSWQGRFPEAFAESEQARQLDPISLIGATDRASILYESRQYDSALKQWRSVLDLDPTYDHAEHLMIPAYLQLGRYDDAVRGIERWEAVGESPWMWGWKAAVYARAGHPDEARRALAKLDQSSGSQANRAVTLLIAYLGTGQKERALELLQQMYAEHSNAVVQIKVDPMFDPLRSDPRFKNLLLRLGLER